MSPVSRSVPSTPADPVVVVLDTAPEILALVRGALEVAVRTGRVLLLADVLQYAEGRWRATIGREPTPSQLLDLVEDLVPVSVSTEHRAAAYRACRTALALEQAPAPRIAEPGHTTALHDLDGPAAEYLTRLLAGDGAGALEHVRSLLAAGMPVGDLLVEVLESSEVAIGAMWAAGQASVAEEHFCTSVTERAMVEVYATLFTGRRHGPRLLAAHPVESLQNIGLRMVSDLLEAHGWSTSYLGGYADVDQLLEVVDSVRPDVLALSASMASQVPALMDVLDRLRRHPEHHALPVVVGGRPFLLDPGLAPAIGADGTARDARAALDLCTLLVEKGR